MHKQLALILLAALSSTIFMNPAQSFAQIGTSNIANNAVTSPKIRDGEVKTPDIANNAVDTSKISNGAVETNDLADDAVTSQKIDDGSITIADLSPGIVNTETEKLKAVSQIIFNSCSIDFPSIPAQQISFAFCPVIGAKTGDKVIVTSQDEASGLVTQSASVNATDLVRISVRNPNFIATDPPKISWAMIIFRT
ncbi:MAG TPA: hypothetical protein VF884_10175 [Nitrososphaeraceae archaeon]